MVPAVFSLLHPGFFVTDDGTWMIIRLSSFYDTMRDGQIPVRMLERLNNGYGYPVANFLYPGFMYIGSIIHVLGFGFVDTVKILMISSIFLSGFFTYFWLKKIFDPIASVAGSLFFVYTPYHLYDIYVRGSVGEILAFVFIPFTLWQIERRSTPVAALGVFLLIISHNSLALLMLPIIILYGFMRWSFLSTVYSIGLGILLSSFFIIPAATELSFTKFSSISVSNPLNYFSPLALIGYSSVGVLILVTSLLIFNRKTLDQLPYLNLVFLFFITSVGSILMSSSISSFAWDFIPSQLLQFPFRLLSILIVSLSFLAAFFVNKLPEKLKIPAALFSIFLLAYSAFPYLSPSERTSLPDEYYSTNMDTTTVKDEYMPIWVIDKPTERYKSLVEVPQGEAKIDVVHSDSRIVRVKFQNGTNSIVRLNNIYYPGWKAYINNEEVNIAYTNNYGVMDVKLTRQAGDLVYVFGETLIRYVSNTVTAIAFVITIFLFARPLILLKQNT